MRSISKTRSMWARADDNYVTVIYFQLLTPVKIVKITEHGEISLNNLRKIFQQSVKTGLVVPHTRTKGRSEFNPGFKKDS